MLCRGEVASGLSYTLATALFRLTARGVSLEVLHGPSREPVHCRDRTYATGH